MTEVDTLVSCLVAHLDKVEQEARATEPGPWGAWPAEMPGEWYVATRNSRTGGPNSHRVATAQGLYAAEQNAAWVALWHPEAVLGLVRATRDLIDQWRAAAERAEQMQADRRHGAFVMQQEAGRDGLASALRVVARGWGVTGDKEDRDG